MIIDKENLFGKDVDCTSAFAAFPDVIDLGEKHEYISESSRTSGTMKIFFAPKGFVGLTSSFFVTIEGSNSPTFGAGTGQLLNQMDIPQANMEAEDVFTFSIDTDHEFRYIQLTYYQNGVSPSAGTGTCGLVLDSQTNL